MKNSSILPFLAMRSALGITNDVDEELRRINVKRTTSVRLSPRDAKAIKANKKNKLARKARKLNRKK